MIDPWRDLLTEEDLAKATADIEDVDEDGDEGGEIDERVPHKGKRQLLPIDKMR